MLEKASAIFLKTGVLTPQGLNAAIALKQRDGGTLSEAILRLGLLDEEHLVSAFQKNLQIPRVSAAALARVSKDVLNAIPAELAAQLRVIPMDIDASGSLTLAMVDPSDDEAVEQVIMHTLSEVNRAVASPTAMREALRTHYGVVLNKPGAPQSAPAAAQAASKTGPVSPVPQASQAVVAPQTVAAPATAKPAAAASTPAPATAKPAAASTPAPATAKPAAAVSTPAPATAKPAAAVSTPAPATAKPAAVSTPAPAVTVKPAEVAAAVAPAKPAAAVPAAVAAQAPAAKPVAQAQVTPSAKPVQTAAKVSSPAIATAPVAAKPAVSAPTTAPAKVAASAPVAAVKTAPQAAPAAVAKQAVPGPGAMHAAAKLEPASLKALVRAFDSMDSGPAPQTSGRFAVQFDKMQKSSERDEVVAILLDAVKPLAAQVALFVIQQRQFACLDGRGSSVDMLKWVQFSTEEPSPFQTVVASKEPFLGKLAPTAENQSALTSLGSSSGPLLLVPLMFKGRGIGVLYADELKGDLKPMLGELAQLADEAATAFARIILARKKSG